MNLQDQVGSLESKKVKLRKAKKKLRLQLDTVKHQLFESKKENKTSDTNFITMAIADLR